MKNILVCTDLCARSSHAIKRAAQLAQQHESKLTICTVLDDDLPERLRDGMKAEAQAELAAIRGALAHDNIETVVSLGEPVRSILSLGDSLAADLVVLGVHRHRPIWDLFKGTTMERIVHASRRPVLLVPIPVKGEYEKVLGGIDLSPSCEAALRLAAMLAPGAAFSTFHAVKLPRGKRADTGEADTASEAIVADAARRVDAWWAERDIPASIERPRVLPLDRAEAFRKLRSDVKPDLLAIGAHGRKGFGSGLLGDFTGSVLREQSCDVLVVRGRA